MILQKKKIIILAIIINLNKNHKKNYINLQYLENLKYLNKVNLIVSLKKMMIPNQMVLIKIIMYIILKIWYKIKIT